MKVMSFLITSTILISCQSDFSAPESETINIEAYQDVDQRLWTHFESFEIEAGKRGLFFDLNALNVTGEIVNISEENVAGTCQYGSHINHVTVDTDFWFRNNDLQREFVVFHELGHCVLKRDHLESSFNNGICTSMMHSGLTRCNVAYNNINREYYLDELFASI